MSECHFCASITFLLLVLDLILATTKMGTLEDRSEVLESIFREHDSDYTQELTALQLQILYSDIRIGGLSLPQIKASIEYVCATDTCFQSELFDLLKEMDRRYFLLQDFQWEFSMLDTGNNKDKIYEEQARWFVQTVHGKFFSKHKWEIFLKSRAVPGSGVTFPEIEVILCNIPSAQDLRDEADEDRKAREALERKRQELEKLMELEKEKRRKQKELEKRQNEAAEKRRKKEQDVRRQQEQAEEVAAKKAKADEEKRRKKLEEEEERGRREAEERQNKIEEDRQREQEQKRLEFLEAQRLQQLEEKHRKEEEERKLREEAEAQNDEITLKKAIEEEKLATEAAEMAKKKLQEAQDSRTKQEAEEEQRVAELKVKENRNMKIRYNLKIAVKTRDMDSLPKAVEHFKKAKLPDDEKELAKAERILKEAMAKRSLNQAMNNRILKELESAINFVKRKGFELSLAKEMLEANKILLQLRRLERIRAEILELKQSTVAEIRSYQKPPPIVHTVMTATFLILGHKESETKDWKTVQALVGKTGKEGLKRRCLECEPGKINHDAANRAKELFHSFGLEEVRDVSAGAATFYVWGTTMIEELEAILAAKAAGTYTLEVSGGQKGASSSNRGRTPARKSSTTRSTSKSATRKVSASKSPAATRKAATAAAAYK